ncbi:MAG: cytochrome P450, partial [Candidatus Hydrogenedentes bacterium]|nr:cytochrome P450 [Candidatus Hydrogenedentota bacterium]
LIALTPAFRKWWFPPWRRFQRIKRSSADFLARYMSERRAVGKESSDVLGILMASRHEDGTTVSNDEILGKLGTIVMAGHKNSAAALAWALYELAHQPSALGRLREELDALGPDPDPESIAKLPYLGAVCDEVLRLHTTHTEIARMCQVPLKLLGYTVPKGASVGVGICAIHQDSAIYPEPERFQPERFIGRSFSPFEYLPYGGGHRRCIGASLAAFEIRVALATIVMRWELESLGTERDARKNIVMGPKRGVPMRVTARRQS